MCIQIIASVGSWVEEKTHFSERKEVLGQFTINPIMGHVVGKKTLTGIALASTREKRLQWCGKHALPHNTYLTVGEIVHCDSPAWSVGKPRKGDFEIIMDCGIPVRCVRVGSYRFPNHASEVMKKDAQIGNWVVLLGSMHFYTSEKREGDVKVRALRRKIIDLRVDSPTFSQLIDWELEATLLYDDTELPYSPNYYLFEVLKCK